jgi:MFS family permease
MVGPAQLRNAIGINASVFQLGALVGPAVSGVLIGAVGSGYAFAINALSYLGPIAGLLLIRERELNRIAAPASNRTTMRDGVRYVVSRPDVLWPTVLVGAFGIFTMNLPVTLAAYARSVFHSGAAGYGLLTSVVAFGSVAGALISARKPRTRLRGLAVIAGSLAGLELLAAAAPEQWAYCLVLLALGGTTLLFLTSANSTVQLAAHDGIRGRVMGVYLLVFIGSGALGGPLVGSVDQHLGPRAGMLVAGAASFVVTGLVALWLARAGGLRLGLRPTDATMPRIGVVPR